MGGHAGGFAPGGGPQKPDLKRVVAPAITATERGLAIAEEVEREADSRSQGGLLHLGRVVAEGRFLIIYGGVGRCEDQAVEMFQSVVVRVGIGRGGQARVASGLAARRDDQDSSLARD